MDSDRKPILFAHFNETDPIIPDVVTNVSEPRAERQKPPGEKMEQSDETPESSDNRIETPDVREELSCNHNEGDAVESKQNVQKLETKVYKRRWYMLVVYSLSAATQGCVYSTWGSIAASSEEAFGWTDGDIALLSSWGPIAYIICAGLFSWIIDVKGLRIATVTTMCLVVAGAGVRCITDKPPYVKWTMNIGQLLNGLGGPVAFGLPPILSATWFPPRERTTATAIATIIAGSGQSVTYLLAPYIVSEMPPTNNNHTTNTSRLCNSSVFMNHSYVENTTDKHTRIQNERDEIMKLMYIEAAWALFILLVILVYFPAKPKLPPSITASTKRMDFKTGLKALIRIVSFWAICLVYGMSLGFFFSWQSVLDVNLKTHNISQSEAGWLGYYAGLGSGVSTLFVARFADVFSKHLKFFLLILTTASGASFLWFTILINGYIPNSVPSFYASVILGSLLVSATVPLYFEMACEVTYPVGEGVTIELLTLVNNIGGLIFLLIQMIPNVGTIWQNWSLVGSIFACIPVLCLIKERYNRLDVDESCVKKSDIQTQ